MKKKALYTFLFFVAMVVTQQALTRLRNALPTYREQHELIIDRDMDPALFFYTESEHALKAEKEVRERINPDK